jgi:chromosome segregation ATPase
LQNRIAGLGRDLSFEQHKLRLEVQELESQAAEQREEFKVAQQSLQALEDRKKTISRDESSQNLLSQEIATLQQKIIALDTNLERTQATLKDKNDQLTQTFSDQYPDEVSAMGQLDEKIGLIKSSVNAIGVEFP